MIREIRPHIEPMTVTKHGTTMCEIELTDDEVLTSRDGFN